MKIDILRGDVRQVLPTLPSDHFDCIVTSPPYWGLRSYLPNDHKDKKCEIGLEPTMTEYLTNMVEVCRELKRVLKPTGTFWLNIGDSYVTSPPGNKFDLIGRNSTISNNVENLQIRHNQQMKHRNFEGLKKKDLCMIPNRLAILLQEDGWYVRSEIIWHKPSCLPESVKDRPTRAHEKVWLLAKSEKYFYDADSIRNEPSEALLKQIKEGYNGKATKEYDENGVQNPSDTKSRIIEKAKDRLEQGLPIGGNARNVWSITPKGFNGAHFATMPQELAERCIRAGCPENGVVLDPFGGSGTTGVAANVTGRNAVLIELNEEYATMAEERTRKNNLMEHLVK